MISYTQIQDNADEDGEEARANERQPYRFTIKQRARMLDGDEEPLSFVPNIGSYAPPGFVELSTFFVDSSGFGETGEAAMSILEFLNRAGRAVGAYWAIVEVGQFQIYIAQFKPELEEE